MFDVGFSELLVIAVVALLVLGPERLPKAARFAGLWMRRARAQWNSVKSEFEREIANEDIKRTLHETQASLRDAQASLRDAGSHFQRELQNTGELMRGTPLPSPPATPSPDGSAFDPNEQQQAYDPLPDPPPSADDAHTGR
jgi:sec-independent protein translocase protein TatB